MVRTRSPVRIWLSAPEKKPLNTRDVFFGAGGISVKSTPNKEECFFLPLCFISLKSTPNKEECFFLPLCFISLKSTPNKEECFFFRCVSSPSKTFLTTRAFFWSYGASPSKALPTKRSAFSSAVFHFPQKTRPKIWT